MRAPFLFLAVLFASVCALAQLSHRQDVVLIRASGCNLEHTGAIAGMSGSPIYLQDGTGKARLIGDVPVPAEVLFHDGLLSP